MSVTEFSLENGIPVLFERLDHLHSVTIGVWVLVGSRHEKPEQWGVSHLVEHMLFKGTRTRSPLQIAQALEFVGGEINAFTSREYSCFWTKSASQHFGMSVDVLSDIVVNSQFDIEEFTKERKVILEEIAMYEDAPEDHCSDLLTGRFFDENLGHPIVGTTKIVGKIPRDQVFDYYKKMYTHKSVFITVVGNVPESEVRKQMEKFRWEDVPKKAKAPTYPKAKYTTGVAHSAKKIEQAHVAMAFRGLPTAAADRYVLHLLNAYLGGGMSSVLFQEVREKRGMAYSIYSFVQSYEDSGMLGIYCGTNPKSVKAMLVTVCDEIRRLRDNGIPPERLGQMKEQLKGNLLLAMEKPSFRMNRLGVGHRYFGRILSVEEVVATIDAISTDQVDAMARKIFADGISAISGVGQFPRRELSAGARL